MILDNENENLKVHEWIKSQAAEEKEQEGTIEKKMGQEACFEKTHKKSIK